MSFLENEARAILPQGFTIDYAGESRQLRTEGRTFLGTFLLSAVLIYLVLAAQFESFRDPFIILAGSVPLAISGALMFSFLGLTTLNIYSQVGLITLVGLVSKNGILIVQFANHLQETGMDKLAAVIEAAGTRLRPILMTTAATVAGHFPLVTATGPGAGARNSIGIMLVSGMIIGTAFTLFVVPSIYMLVARRHSAEESPGRLKEDSRAGRSSAITGVTGPRGAAARPSRGFHGANSTEFVVDRRGGQRRRVHGWRELSPDIATPAAFRGAVRDAPRIQRRSRTRNGSTSSKTSSCRS